jgi:hypothetical protein
MLTGEMDDLDQEVRYELTMKYAALLFLLPLPLAASPWVLPEGQLVVVGRYDYETAREEFLEEGDSLVYSLNGKLVSTTYTAWAPWRTSSSSWSCPSSRSPTLRIP